jgi:hypothetical protein
MSFIPSAHLAPISTCETIGYKPNPACECQMTDQQPPFEQRKWEREQEIERAKWLHDLKRDDAKRAHDTNRDFHSNVNQEAIGASNLTLRTLVIINGGAAIAVLTFLGGVAAKDKVDFEQVSSVAGTIKWFAFGVALAVLGMALSYLTHYATASISTSRVNNWEHPYVVDGPKTKGWRRTTGAFHVAAIVVAIGSLILFLVGMLMTSYAITHLVVR